MCTEDTGSSYPSTLEYVRVYVCVYSVDWFLKVSLRLNIHRKFHHYFYAEKIGLELLEYFIVVYIFACYILIMQVN